MKMTSSIYLMQTKTFTQYYNCAQNVAHIISTMTSSLDKTLNIRKFYLLWIFISFSPVSVHLSWLHLQRLLAEKRAWHAADIVIVVDTQDRPRKALLSISLLFFCLHSFVSLWPSFYEKNRKSNPSFGLPLAPFDLSLFFRVLVLTLFSKNCHSLPLFPFFPSFWYSWQDKICRWLNLNCRPSGIRNDRYTNWATTTARVLFLNLSINVHSFILHSKPSFIFWHYSFFFILCLSCFNFGSSLNFLSLFTLLKPAKYPGSTILVQCCQGKFIQQ